MWSDIAPVDSVEGWSDGRIIPPEHIFVLAGVSEICWEQFWEKYEAKGVDVIAVKGVCDPIENGERNLEKDFDVDFWKSGISKKGAGNNLNNNQIAVLNKLWLMMKKSLRNVHNSHKSTLWNVLPVVE